MFRMRSGNLILNNTNLITPSTGTNGVREFVFPANALRMNLSGGQVYRDADIIVRGDRLYNKLHHTTDVRDWRI